MSEPKGTCPGQVRRVKWRYTRNTVRDIYKRKEEMLQLKYIMHFNFFLLEKYRENGRSEMFLIFHTIFQCYLTNEECITWMLLIFMSNVSWALQICKYHFSTCECQEIVRSLGLWLRVARYSLNIALMKLIHTVDLWPNADIWK